MKISVGIVGYGNLGKALKKQLSDNDYFNLEAVFSRRKIKGTISTDDILKYKDKIQILFLCVGSQNDLEKQALCYINDFDIVECYDNHAKLQNYHKKLDKVAKNSRHVALCSLGWDPGLFSLMRGLFESLDLNSVTFWGKGTSQGHTQAIKNIVGVEDAIQFTVPDKKKILMVKKGKNIWDEKELHHRQCFVVAKKNYHDSIKNQILTMKDYFKGYKTTIKFVSNKKLEKIKCFSHKGEVATVGDIANFSLNLPSNPEFTAKVMVAYAKSLSEFVGNGNFGVKTIFDIPLKYICKDNIYCYL